MKKLSIVLLVLCMFLSAFAIVTYASEPEGEDATVEVEPTAEPVPQVIDLSEYDDDTIAALYEQVKAELVARRIEKTAHLKASPVPYVIGRDIPAGDYLIQKGDLEGVGYIQFGTPNEEDPSASEVKINEFVADDDDFVAYINAEDGDILIIDFDCDLTISTGVKFE